MPVSILISDIHIFWLLSLLIFTPAQTYAIFSMKWNCLEIFQNSVFRLPVTGDLNYFYLGYQDATEINFPEAWMNWRPIRRTDFTHSSSLTKSHWNNQGRAQLNASGNNIQTIKDTNRKLTSGYKMSDTDRQGGSQRGDIERMEIR